MSANWMFAPTWPLPDAQTCPFLQTRQLQESMIKARIMYNEGKYNEACITI